MLKNKKIRFNLLLILSIFFNGCSQIPLYSGLPACPPESIPPKNVNVALVLSGGGAKGVAHAGVLEVLEKEKIPIDLIVGSSAGSMIGAFYADNPDSYALREKVLKTKKRELLDPSLSQSFQMLWGVKGFMRGHALKRYLTKNLEADEFCQLKIPLAVVTTDVNAARAYVIDSGVLVPAIHASSAIPLAFEPLQMYGKTLVDGGVISPLPVEIAKKYDPKMIIAVYIGNRPEEYPVTTNFELLYRSIHISYYALAIWQTYQADILIRPAVDAFGFFDDRNNLDLYLAGKIAALKALPDIHKALKKANIALR